MLSTSGRPPAWVLSWSGTAAVNSTLSVLSSDKNVVRKGMMLSSCGKGDVSNQASGGLLLRC